MASGTKRVLQPGILKIRHRAPVATVADRLSTTDPLDNGNTWTSEWVDVSGHSSLIVAVKTDQNGIFYVDFSPDGTNVDSTLTRYYNTGQIEAPHRYTITRQYARVRFTNDSGSNQTSLRLQTLLGEHNQLNAPIDGTLSRDFDAIVVRPTDPHTEVLRELRQGSFHYNKFGYNNDVDAAAAETIWAVGGTYTPPTTASTLTIVSSSTSDDGDPAGVGANLLYIDGIDANRERQIETVTLNGTTNVVTTSTWLGINRAAVALAGSSLGNVGNITITATTGGATLAYLPAGDGTTQQCIFHNPTDHIAIADDLFINALKDGPGSSPSILFQGLVYSPVANANFEVFRYRIDTDVENTLVYEPNVPFRLNSGDVLWFNATTDQDNTVVQCRFSLIVHKDVDAT